MNWKLSLSGSESKEFRQGGNVEIQASGFTGHATERRQELTRGGLSSELDAVTKTLERCDFREVQCFDLDLQKPQRSGDSDDSVQLRLEAPQRDFTQCLLAEDMDGGLTWHFPEQTAATRSLNNICQYNIPCRSALIQPDGSSRSVLGWVNRLFLKVLVFPVTDPFFGAAGEFLASKWEKKNRPYSIRQMTPDNYSQNDGQHADQSLWNSLAKGRTLLFVHGTFSTIHTGFGDIPPAAFAEMYDSYEGRVIGFNHHSLSHSPHENVEWFLQQIPRDAQLDLDMITHSRGGLVARCLTDELAQRGHLVRRILFAGTPNRGTPLASPGHSIDLLNRYTSLTRFLPSNPATEMLEAVMMLVKAAAHGTLKRLPGLASMDPGGEFLAELNSRTNLSPQTEYYAIAADYVANHDTKKLGAFVHHVTTDRVVDSLFNESENDLVVPYRGVYEHNGHPKFPIPDEHVLRYRPNHEVHHCSLFPPAETKRKLNTWFKSGLVGTSPQESRSASEFPSHVALVIGNGKYRDRPLKNPVNDAKAISHTLGKMGYGVDCFTDCDFGNFQNVLRGFSDRARHAETSIFYYAGHGIQFEGENYLLPVDAKMEHERHAGIEGVRLLQVVQQLESAAGGNHLVILDCCRDNPSASSTRGGARGLVEIPERSSNIVIAFATAPGRVAADGVGEHSPYTDALLQHMATPGESVLDVLTKVHGTVRQTTNHRQKPWKNDCLFRLFSLVPEEGDVEQDDSEPSDPEPSDSEPSDSEPSVSEVVEAEVVEAEVDNKAPVPEVELNLDDPDGEQEVSNDHVRCRFSPTYVERLVGELTEQVPIRFFAVRRTLPKVQVEALLRQGCIERSVYWLAGKPELTIAPYDLADAGFLELFTSLLEELRAQPKTQQRDRDVCELALFAYFLDGDKKSAVDYAEQWLREWEPFEDGEYAFAMHWLLCRLDRRAMSRKFLEKTKPDDYNVPHFATAWAQLHGEPMRARHMLETQEVVGLFEDAYFDLFEDEETVRANLEAYGETDPDCFEEQLALVLMFDDVKLMKSRLLNYCDVFDRELAYGSNDVVSVTTAWRSFLDVQSEITKLLTEAEENADELSDFSLVASSWFELLGDMDSTVRCYRKLQSTAGCPKALRKQVAKVIKNEFIPYCDNDHPGKEIDWDEVYKVTQHIDDLFGVVLDP